MAAETSPKLTSRERQVLALIASGKTNKEIATALCISVKTTEFHRAQLLSRLGVHNTADLTRAAIRLGIIEP